jgi:hypothetical protein
MARGSGSSRSSHTNTGIVYDNGTRAMRNAEGVSDATAPTASNARRNPTTTNRRILGVGASSTAAT